jgi:hypothetical protein
MQFLPKKNQKKDCSVAKSAHLKNFILLAKNFKV